nr:putative reverse transcriptase domain-containing protein [Tanacetum cinerariifolium]
MWRGHKRNRYPKRNDRLAGNAQDRAYVMREGDQLQGPNVVIDVPVIRDFPEVFPDDLSKLPPSQQVEFRIEIVSRAASVARAPYHLAPSEMKELSGKLYQKSYADRRLKPLEFEVGDKVLLKVSPWKGVIRLGKRRKLSPQYIRPFKIIDRIGPVAYKLELLVELQGIHNTFHVSNLKKCLANENLVIPRGPA